MRTNTNLKRITKLLLQRGELTSAQIPNISNANQYFVRLEKMGVTGSRWSRSQNGSKCKMRFIKDTNKALAFIGAKDEPNKK